MWKPESPSLALPSSDSGGMASYPCSIQHAEEGNFAKLRTYQSSLPQQTPGHYLTLAAHHWCSSALHQLPSPCSQSGRCKVSDSQATSSARCHQDPSEPASYTKSLMSLHARKNQNCSIGLTYASSVAIQVTTQIQVCWLLQTCAWSVYLLIASPAYAALNFWTNRHVPLIVMFSRAMEGCAIEESSPWWACGWQSVCWQQEGWHKLGTLASEQSEAKTYGICAHPWRHRHGPKSNICQSKRLKLLLAHRRYREPYAVSLSDAHHEAAAAMSFSGDRDGRINSCAFRAFSLTTGTTSALPAS